MNRFFKWLTIILAICLPLHGAITVFLPDFFRYWKEIVLILFFAGFSISYLQKNKRLSFPRFDLRSSSIYALLFLIYGVILISFSEDKVSSLVAFRYLGMGMFVYLLFSSLNQNFAGFKETFQTNFSKFFIGSSIFSVLFGVWVKFGNGFSLLQNFYSQTISSWVPGQIIPIWHKAGDFIRMQGTSSGPIEFSHILLVSLFLTLTSKIKESYKILFSAIFLFGIYQSYSRAAIFGAVIILIYFLLQKINFSFEKNKKILFVTFLVIFFAGFIGISQTNILSRAGTSDHFTRPLEAAKFGFENIFSNNIGKLGPAARAKNLLENNDDRAMIAENVFVDIFAQMGIIGISLYLLFFYFLVINLKNNSYGFFAASFLLMNLATIFDMTPLSIAFFMVFFISNTE